MPSEHFITLFDNNYLPIGLCLHQSMVLHCQPFHLWILCMDVTVERHLRKLALPYVTLIPISEIEDSALLAVKSHRTAGEYCWTLTPFSPKAVFDRDSTVECVTYIDADMYFFSSPTCFFTEFRDSGKHVMVTEYAMDSDVGRETHPAAAGRFCVQFMPFRRTKEAENILYWWQNRCIEWCYNRFEDGRFGDQKYLDQWPELFENEVHILQQREKTLAPWNLRYIYSQNGCISPVVYHFSGLKLISPNRLLLYVGRKVGKASKEIYSAYMRSMERSIQLLAAHKIEVAYLPWRKGLRGFARLVKNCVLGRIAFGTLKQENVMACASSSSSASRENPPLT